MANARDKHPARMVADAFEAAMMQMQEEKWFASEQEKRFFYRLSALIRRHIERELHVGIEESKMGDAHKSDSQPFSYTGQLNFPSSAQTGGLDAFG